MRRTSGNRDADMMMGQGHDSTVEDDDSVQSIPTAYLAITRINSNFPTTNRIHYSLRAKRKKTRGERTIAIDDITREAH